MNQLRNTLSMVAMLAAFATGAMAQTTSLEGKVIGEDGAPLKDAIIKIERTDIKGNYKTKSGKKGDWFHAGLPIGTYTITCEVNGAVVDSVRGVRSTLGDPKPVDFDLSKLAARRKAMEKAAQTGEVTEEVSREMSKEQKEAMEKAVKERAAQMAKNKELNDAFNAGMENLKAKNWEASVQGFEKAAVMDPKQVVVWANMADAYIGLASTKTGDEQTAAMTKGLESYSKALELKPDDAGMHNNYALALAKSKKFDEASKELDKAAQLDPAGGGRYFYNLGAILTNIGQSDAAAAAFKRALELDPNYADAHYQWGIHLIGKAKVEKDGSITPPEGTAASFQKYLELKPDGPFAESAKSMLTTMGAKVDTTYVNPNAPKSTPKTGKKK